MCGIAGFSGIGDRSDIQRMTDALAHRGPDGEGFHIDEKAHVFLGHRRLAIVDIASGDQPMWTADHQVGVVFNGEIYNHGELRAELVARGHRFLTDHSDTEVLLHGYREWGEGLPVRLNGMFAFVIYDKVRGRLFAARDRFGEKPFYYSHRRGFFGFASELTALAAHRSVDRSLNTRSLQKFFAYGYLPSPHAMLNGTAKLPGGFSLSYDIAADRLETRAYWRFSIEADDSLGDADEDRLVDECGALLSQAAKRRLMSDVPLGIFLSGGLDSSVVLASLRNFVPGDALQTFTIGFEEPSFDESGHARIVADYLGTAHHEQCLSMALARETMPGVLSRLDEPLGDASILPTQLLCAFARKNVTVALTGDGGDELFAGYDPFLALGPAKLYDGLVPSWLHKGARRLVDLLPVSHANMSLDFKLRRSLMGLSYPADRWLPVWMAPLDPADMKALFEAPLRVEDVYDEAISLWDAGRAKPVADRALEFFTRFYLQDNILMKSDRAAMMNSLETRAVFLDNDLAEFCRRLPSRFKFHKGQRKYILKKVAQRMLPRAIIERKKKGFGIPLAKWLEHVPVTPPLQPVPGLITDYARKAFAGHRSGRQDNRLFLWSWLSVQAFAGAMADAS
ncbi:asparagine synthetase B [Rhizomicrobium sp. SCGC AG-212-E05]|nr:asparagine synthetase B [Rhizomicrobium sp. SCGC AG-212-E05]